MKSEPEIKSETPMSEMVLEASFSEIMNSHGRLKLLSPGQDSRNLSFENSSITHTVEPPDFPGTSKMKNKESLLGPKAPATRRLICETLKYSSRNPTFYPQPSPPPLSSVQPAPLPPQLHHAPAYPALAARHSQFASALPDCPSKSASNSRDPGPGARLCKRTRHRFFPLRDCWKRDPGDHLRAKCLRHT